MPTSAPLDSVPLWHRARLGPLRLWRYRPWTPGHWAALRYVTDVTCDAPPADDETHLRAAVDWLCRAQDESGDGGVIGRYLMRSGWTRAYPETTGYIVPSFLALAEHYGEDFVGRAERGIEFLLGTQLDNGAFPAGEIGQDPVRPSPFNSGQILNGLTAWYEHSGDSRVAKAARRAADWLVDVQDADGAWRRWFYHDEAACYAAHLACWLAEAGAVFNEPRYVAAVDRHLDWVMTQHVAATGWFDRTGFSTSEQALRVADLHTVAYTLAGLLGSARVCGRDDVMAATIRAARAVGASLDRLGWLPGVLDHEWRAKADSSCLTGNVQMALVWYRLDDVEPDETWAAWARRAITITQAAQLIECTNPGLRGGIPGCTPMWGWYNDGSVMSWSAKFFIDAMLVMKRRGASP